MGELVKRKPFEVVLKPRDRRDIYTRIFGEGHLIKDVAADYGVHRNTIGKHLVSDEGKKAKAEIERAMNTEVRGRLVKGARRAVESWLQQLELADSGQRANHQPAKDLLTHIGALDIPMPARERGTQILIQIGGGTITDVKAVEGEVLDADVEEVE